MTDIYNIATVVFKLYGSTYKLRPYNKDDTVSELMIKYRINNNLYLKDLSIITGYSMSYLCNIETNFYTSTDKLKQIILSLLD